ncbi:MAG: YbaK/EbsC family protein [Verrucomicrobiales bacterium]
MTVTHSLAFTAHEVAVSAHVPDREMAKTVIVNVKGELAMAVLPASYHIDFHRLMNALKTSDMYLATEEEFKSRFPDPKSQTIMKDYHAPDIRNFAVVGHATSGKTMLCEAMLAC